LKLVAGVDEVGRGPLAGPVVAAAVILREGKSFNELADSKSLSAKKREELNILIKDKALSWKIAFVSSKKIPMYKNFFNKTKILSPFKLNINYQKYKKIFNLFSKKIRQGETYQIKICTKYKNNSDINYVNFFWNLMKIISSPESFMIRDKDFSIVSCSPETLIDKKGKNIITKPIAGTLRKNKKTNKRQALNFFRNNDKETKEHNMIVDMERSDLSRICKSGSKTSSR